MPHHVAFRKRALQPEIQRARMANQMRGACYRLNIQRKFQNNIWHITSTSWNTVNV